MLTLYAAKWCPHCTKTVDYLKKNKILFNYIEIEEQPQEIVQKVIDANGGDDWVVPTLEYKGKWREGKVFNELELYFDLKKIGII
ncbi:MAG: NrdH-redoxin [Desulfobacterales bacterium RIFOXYA12_FULL_46_15]|nr:MAG: NrdH-redoxin [Desulfobacula sp. GWF2_41_7]OGR26353.1 MAG: NrdH-redoxin [Desulfobacterales bacterium RIFOXYA12_FULL_46_15]